MLYSERRAELLKKLRRMVGFSVKFILKHLAWEAIKHTVIWGWPYLLLGLGWLLGWIV